jgi:hypothetical protein
VLQDVLVGRTRLIEPVGVPHPGVLHALADDHLHHDQRDEQHQEHRDARADTALHGLHVRRPGG